MVRQLDHVNDQGIGQGSLGFGLLQRPVFAIDIVAVDEGDFFLEHEVGVTGLLEDLDRALMEARRMRRIRVFLGVGQKHVRTVDDAVALQVHFTHFQVQQGFVIAFAVLRVVFRDI